MISVLIYIAIIRLIDDPEMTIDYEFILEIPRVLNIHFGDVQVIGGNSSLDIHSHFDTVLPIVPASSHLHIIKVGDITWIMLRTLLESEPDTEKF
jgi:hypothetical protein